MTTRLFGTDGVRGVANNELTPELAMRLGEAVGRLLCDHGRGRIVVGRDTRRSGHMLEAALVAGITSAGADALVAGIIPTPAVAVLTRELGADGGAVISASHNPAEYNGIKFFDREGFKLPDELEEEISEFVVAREMSDETPVRPTGVGVGTVEHVDDALERYVAHSVGTVPDGLTGMRIAVDCGHGASSLSTPEALRRLGVDVTCINCEWDGMDINRESGSTHLDKVAAVVAAGAFDLGLAHDGDADRVLFVDENGAEVDGDVVMAVCARHMKERGELPKDTLVATVMSNMGLEVAMRGLDITMIRTKVGDRYVLEQMQAMGAGLGGEQSGHVIFLAHNTTGDGLVTALQVIDVLRDSGKPMSELARVMRRYPQVLINVNVGDKGRLVTSAALAEAVHAAERRLGDDGRVLVRSSGTEPLVRVMVEAGDPSVAQEVADELVAVVSSELG
jgi:phosphoglucosamine mutase